MQYTSEKVEFRLHGDIIRGTLYLPINKSAEDGLLPGVVLGHGWAMTTGGDLESYAIEIVKRNIVCLTFDFRNLGNSTGEPRQHIDPYKQIEDMRSAIDYLQLRNEVDKERIGIWGSSYAGGHVISVTGIDSRVKVAVSQVPTISGFKSKLQTLSEEELIERGGKIIAARLMRESGLDSVTIKTVSNQNEVCTYSDISSFSYMTSQSKICPLWRNYTTVASLDLAQAYEPYAYLYRIRKAAFLMIIASHDTTTPTNLQEQAFEEIPSLNKKLITVDGGHYSVYEEHFDQTSQHAADWFESYL